MCAFILPEGFEFKENALSHVERCFILGCGPTLNKFNLKKLNCEFVIGVNRILLSGFTPSIICFSDPGTLNEDYIKLLYNVDSKLVFAKHIVDSVLKYNNFPQNKIHKVYNLIFKPMYPYNYKSIYTQNLEHTQCIGSVIGDIAIPLAIYLGIKKIFLLGVDSYYDVINIKQAHFWKQDITKNELMMIRDERYRQVWFGKLDILARLKGVNIVNLSPGSALIAFEKKDANILFPDIIINNKMNIVGKYVEYDGELFKIVPGNNSHPNTCSLKNIKTSLYIRHYNGEIIESDKSINDNLFNDDSSFFAEISFVDKEKVSFSSYNLKYLYITKDVFGDKYSMHSCKADFIPDKSSFDIFSL